MPRSHDHDVCFFHGLSVWPICAARQCPSGKVRCLGQRLGDNRERAVACGLMISLGIGSLIKSRFLSHLLGRRVIVWRWTLVLAVAAAALLGFLIVSLPARFEWVELTIGIPAILGLYGWIIWSWGFGPEDRVLFRKKRD